LNQRRETVLCSSNIVIESLNEEFTISAFNLVKKNGGREIA